MVSDAISCPFYNLKALWCIIIILHSYVEQVLMMCCVQEIQLSLAYFLSYLPLMVKGTMPSILNTVRNTFMRLYDIVEAVVTILNTVRNTFMRLYDIVEAVVTICLV